MKLGSTFSISNMPINFFWEFILCVGAMFAVLAVIRSFIEARQIANTELLNPTANIDVIEVSLFGVCLFRQKGFICCIGRNL